MENLSPGREKNINLYLKNSFKYLLYPYFQFYRLSRQDLKELAQLKEQRRMDGESSEELF